MIKDDEAKTVRIIFWMRAEGIRWIILYLLKLKQMEMLKLHDKIKSAEEFMDVVIVKMVLEAKGIRNKVAHEGEEVDYTVQDVDASLKAIQEFSLEIFYSYKMFCCLQKMGKCLTLMGRKRL